MTDWKTIPTAPCPIAREARRHPDAVAVVTPHGQVTYAALDRRIERCVRRCSFLPGSRVSFQSDPSLPSLVLFWAIFRSRAIAVPISTRYPAAQAVRLAEQVGGELLSRTHPAFVEPTAMEDPARPILPTPDHGAPPEIATLDCEIPATIIFSSGSTGRPKAIVHNLRAHFCSAAGANANMPLEPSDRWLLSLPTYHVGGLAVLFRCAIAGAAVVIPESSGDVRPRWSDPGVTHVSLVPTQLKRMLDAAQDLSPWKAILLGGSAIPPGLIDRAHQAGGRVFSTYGMTEMASQIATGGGTSSSTASGGRVLKFREARISGHGEILVRGATLASGYWTPEGIQPIVDDDGWFPTGDAGRIDADGRLHVTGRRDNQFISGGENIYPEEIERCLLDVSGVRRAIVIAVPDAEYGQRPVAVVDGDFASGDLPVAMIRTALQERLPKFKIPDAIYSWPEDLECVGIKPDRNALAEFVRMQWERPK